MVSCSIVSPFQQSEKKRLKKEVLVEHVLCKNCPTKNFTVNSKNKASLQVLLYPDKQTDFERKTQKECS